MSNHTKHTALELISLKFEYDKTWTQAKKDSQTYSL